MKARIAPLMIAIAAAGVLAATGVSQSRDTAFPGGSYFAILCSFSHRNNDDPIVHPGAPGRSHNHTYIGNTNVNAFSTAASLRGGETTCELPGDASTYWIPTLFVGTEQDLDAEVLVDVAERVAEVRRRRRGEPSPRERLDSAGTSR